MKLGSPFKYRVHTDVVLSEPEFFTVSIVSVRPHYADVDLSQRWKGNLINTVGMGLRISLRFMISDIEESL